MQYSSNSYIILLILVIIGCIPLSMYLMPGINYRSMPVGLCEAKLVEARPNWVSSLVDPSSQHYIEPLEANALPLLATRLKKQGGKIHIAHLDENYLLAFRQSPFFNFTDWICIRTDGNLTSSATMGHYDFGKNREWVTNIRNARP